MPGLILFDAFVLIAHSAMTSTSHDAEADLQVFIVDDHPSICDAVADAVESAPGMEMCGAAHTVAQGFSQIEAVEPDVALVDLSFEDGHGLDLVENIQAQVPSVQIIVFSMYDETIYAERAIQAGASGYLMKAESMDRLLEAIWTVQEGETVLSDQLRSEILNRMMEGEASTDEEHPIDALTDRELEVFQMLGEGKSIEDIEDGLSLSRKTIETYRRRAKDKLGFDDVSELLRYAVRWTHGRGTNGPSVEGKDPLLPQEKAER